MKKNKIVAVDLVPIKIGSINGGAKLFVISLLKELIRISIKSNFYIYVSSNAVKEELKRKFPYENCKIISIEREFYGLVNILVFSAKVLKFYNLRAVTLLNKLVTKNHLWSEYTFYRLCKNTFIKISVFLFRIINARKWIKSQNSIIKKILKHSKINIEIGYMKWLSRIFMTKFIFILNLITKTLYLTIEFTDKIITNISNGKNIKFDLFFLPFSNLTLPIRGDKDTKIISIIYDLQHVFYPFYFDSNELQHRKSMYEWISKKATYVISISKQTKKDFYNLTKYNFDKIIPISIPVEIKNINEYQFRDKLYIKDIVISKPYLLYPANFWHHKNHKILFIALAIAIKKNIQSNIKLVLIGNHLDKGQEYKSLVKQLGIEKNVVFLEFVDEKIKYNLLKNARALIYPSLFEGFGMPLIEAILLGTPILCSNLPVLKEISGEKVCLFDPKKPKSIAEAIVKITKDEKYYEQIKKNTKMLRSKVPLMKQIVKTYQDLLKI